MIYTVRVSGAEIIAAFFRRARSGSLSLAAAQAEAAPFKIDPAFGKPAISWIFNDAEYMVFERQRPVNVWTLNARWATPKPRHGANWPCAWGTIHIEPR